MGAHLLVHLQPRPILKEERSCDIQEETGCKTRGQAVPQRKGEEGQEITMEKYCLPWTLPSTTHSPLTLQASNFQLNPVHTSYLSISLFRHPLHPLIVSSNFHPRCLKKNTISNMQHIHDLSLQELSEQQRMITLSTVWKLCSCSIFQE